CDVFCEQGAFDLEESRRVLAAGKDAGLALHVHAEQFSSFGGARLAAELGALSADHLEAATAEDAGALAAAGVVAIGLPGCNLFLDQQARMPARMLLERGVRVALATDYNPGTCPTLSLPLVMTLGCSRLKLSAAEAMAAVTCEAARALGRGGELGTLQPGARADLAAFPVPSHRHLPYYFGTGEAAWVLVDGKEVYRGRWDGKAPGEQGPAQKQPGRGDRMQRS
ncbi:MAG: amidohydrolase family protein, partial [Deltaproteobacteria bacterium]|nr:amidohydrolase family protein [Deltaproteobacteria bacterium]